LPSEQSTTPSNGLTVAAAEPWEETLSQQSALVKQPGKQKERLISPRKTRQASAMSKRKEVTKDDRSAEETRIPANDESPEANPSQQLGSTD
jgi:hypothetical protein